MSEISKGESLDAFLLLQRILDPVTSGDLTLADAMSESFPSLLEALGCKDGRLLLLDRQGSVVFYQEVTDGRSADQTSASLADLRTRGIEAQVLQQGQVRLLADTSVAVDWHVGPHAAAGLEQWSAICAPVVVTNAGSGVLTLLKPGGNRFSPADVPVLLLVTNQIGTTLALADYRERMKSSEERYQNLLQDRQDLAAILVHDLQGPAGNVVTSLEMIQEEVDHGSESSLAVLVDIATRSSRHLQSLIESLLDISRLEAGQTVQDRQALPVSTIIDQVLDIAAPDFEERHVKPVVEIESGLSSILVNADMIQRVLYNLLDNALKQSKQNQSITIRATSDKEYSAVIICVADQGPGIPEEYRARIFEKFQRVDRDTSSKGLGLGLAFCKLAVEAHGGRIWVEDCDKGGACFCLAIPVAEITPPTSSA